jgi:hypothetical protein
MNIFSVITTINKKTDPISVLGTFDNMFTIIVGDKKTPMIRSSENIIYLSVEDQKKLKYEIVGRMPYNHYSRKNIGYLYAIKHGADIILDTDDDNFAYNNWSEQDSSISWSPPNFINNYQVECNSKFINVYKLFCDKNMWPRGFPLEEISKKEIINIKEKNNKIGVFQGLVDGDPDVDAIYRLTINKYAKFHRAAFNKTSVKQFGIKKGIFCPFNSQNTVWCKEAFKYMYLPISVNFRFTDILRGYIAQHLMWKNNLLLGFSCPTAFQKRNKHNIMKDFEDELPYYSKIKDIVDIISDGTNFEDTYKKLYNNNIISLYDYRTAMIWRNSYEG